MLRVCATSVKPGFAGCLSVRRTDVAAHKGTFTADAAPSGYAPSDLQSAHTQPGTYTAQIGFEQDTPYDVFPEKLTITVTAPRTRARSPAG